MNPRSLPPRPAPQRRDRLLEEENHDSYRSLIKLREPTLCPQCKAVFHAGRWQWSPLPEHAHQALCPACRRIADDFPAGFVHLSGPFFAAHRSEIMHLIDHEAQRAYRNHPLQRIMTTRELANGTQITTTDIHLARALGEAVHHAYQGRLAYHYNPEQALLRVTWQH